MDSWLIGLLSLGGAYLLHVGCPILGEYIQGLPEKRREAVLSWIAKGYAFILAISEIIALLGSVVLLGAGFVLFPLEMGIGLLLIVTYYTVVLKLCGKITRKQFIAAIKSSAAEMWRALRFRE